MLATLVNNPTPSYDANVIKLVYENWPLHAPRLKIEHAQPSS
jgi:hypothetical protein